MPRKDSPRRTSATASAPWSSSVSAPPRHAAGLESSGLVSTRRACAFFDGCGAKPPGAFRGFGCCARASASAHASQRMLLRAQSSPIALDFY